MHHPLEERTVELHSGTRAAVATLHRFDSGWTVDVVAEDGQPDRTDSDATYADLSAATKAAEKVWLTSP